MAKCLESAITEGQLGFGGENLLTVVKLNVRPMKLVSAGSRFTQWVSDDGVWLVSGYNSSGQLGLGANANETIKSPSRVITRLPRTPILISSGAQTNFAYIEDYVQDTRSIPVIPTLVGIKTKR